MKRTSFYIINSITLYRLLAAFALLYFLLTGHAEIYKWLLLISFFTDAIDGYLARKYNVVSLKGAKIDSLADDLTVLMAILGIVILHPDFLWQERLMVIVLAGFYLLQLVIAFIRYRKPTAFHTYLAKGTAVLQAVFLLLIFFLPQWPVFLFYLAAVATILDLTEEIILTVLLPRWRADVKGLWWLWKERQQNNS